MEATEREKPLIKDLNEHIVCPLCRGYLIDATTLVECLHSFCRGCIVRRLSSGARACPACNVSTSPPLLPDPRLQRLVYLVVPGLFRSELERRRHFRLVNPQCPPLAPPLGGLDLTLDDFVSLSLREVTDPTENEIGQSRSPNPQESISAAIDAYEDRKQEDEQNRGTRYLKCPAGVTVRHLVRLLMLKRGWEEANAGVNVANRIEMMYEKQDDRRDDGEMRTLNHSWTLLDLACIFGWKRDAPMRLFYRILRKDDTASAPKTSPYNEEPNKDGSSIENIQRPPTPPPSPNPVQEREIEPRLTLETNSKESPSRVLEADAGDKETKTKKPRCEVTPVMRTPEPIGLLTPMQSHHTPENTKELARLEHRKRRKRRNKRVIAEITTTPREDLLKLKVRLTPCPPRITSNNGGSQTKEKLLQMRAVRREKIKAAGISQQRANTALTREEGVKECTGESEETIEDIIDSIPDEVVRIAQNITTQGEEVVCNTVERSTESTQRPVVTSNRTSIKPKDDAKTSVTKVVETTNEGDRPRKDEEILRRLGLVAINEANENLRDKTKQRSEGNGNKIDTLDRERLEKQFRESKANRMRSLLAEKQMRDALKSIMSKTKEENLTTSTMPVNTVQVAPKKKGPPPLAPLRVTKPSSKFQATNAMHDSHNSKYESPLDLSSAGTVNDNVLDLSATLLSTGNTVASSSSFLTSSSSSVSSSSLSSASSLFSSTSSFSRPPRAAVAPGNFLRKSKELEQRRGQDTNLRTLSDAAVSLLSGCISDKTSVDPLVLGSTNVAASKVALRIPQPQRISGFGIKNKPNLGVRHIPNPQAVVASQYRNQRASYFNAVSQQPP